ncbi:MAG: hypothetical protein MJ175_11340, partial [Clostridia bacterium]|nr:hypothetical protein [Clostridia bacterium]
NIISALILVPLAGDTFHVGAVTLANTLGQTVCALILLIAMVRNIPTVLSRAFVSSVCKLIFLTLLSAAAMAAMAFVLHNSAGDAGFIRNIFTCAAVFVPGMIVYLGGLKLLRVRFQT